MRTHRRLCCVLAGIVMAVALAAAGCKTTPPDEKGKKEEPKGPNASVVKLFPSGADVTDWKAAGDAKFYGPAANPANAVEAVESDLGPESALVRGYEFVKSGTRKYTRGAAAAGETLTVRVFEMSNPAEAYGLFSVRAVGTQFPNVGMEARMSNTALGFVKGPFYVSLQYAGTNDPSPVLMEFANAIAGQITQTGYRPALLERVPGGSLQGQRYFLHKFDTLAAVPCVPKGDAATLARMLSLGAETSVAIAGYAGERPGETNCIFVIQYPTEADAKAAFAAYDGYLQNSTNPAEQNIALAPPVRTYLAGTFNAEENSVPDAGVGRKYDMLSSLLKSLGGT